MFSNLTVPNKANTYLSVFLREKEDRGYFLFCGSSKYLRESCARQMARYFVCQGTQDKDCPCYVCSLGNENPDVMVIEPSEAGNVLTGDIKASIAFLNDPPIVGRRRSLIVLDADKMTEASQGNLLKILEVAMDGVLIIMTAGDRRRVVSTIRSRLSVFFTGDSTHKTVFNRLMNEGVSAKKAEEFSRMAQILSCDVLDKVESIKALHEELPKVISYMLRGETKKGLDCLGKIISNFDENGVMNLAEMCVCIFQDIMKVKFQSSTHITMPSRLEWLIEIREKIDEETLDNFINVWKRVASAPKNQIRALTVWGTTVCCLTVNEAKKRRVEEKEK